MLNENSQNTHDLLSKPSPCVHSFTFIIEALYLVTNVQWVKHLRNKWLIHCITFVFFIAFMASFLSKAMPIHLLNANKPKSYKTCVSSLRCLSWAQSLTSFWLQRKLMKYQLKWKYVDSRAERSSFVVNFWLKLADVCILQPSGIWVYTSVWKVTSYDCWRMQNYI